MVKRQTFFTFPEQNHMGLFLMVCKNWPQGSVLLFLHLSLAVAVAVAVDAAIAVVVAAAVSLPLFLLWPLFLSKYITFYIFRYFKSAAPSNMFPNGNHSNDTETQVSTRNVA